MNCKHPAEAIELLEQNARRIKKVLSPSFSVNLYKQVIGSLQTEGIPYIKIEGALSSVGQSTGLLSRVSQVRILQGAPRFALTGYAWRSHKVGRQAEAVSGVVLIKSGRRRTDETSGFYLLFSSASVGWQAMRLTELKEPLSEGRLLKPFYRIETNKFEKFV